MRKKKVKPATVVSYVILTIFALIVLVPFIWFVSTSFDYVKSYSLRFPPRLIPKEFSTFNYKMAFSNVPMLSYLKNTVIIVANRLVPSVKLTLPDDVVKLDISEIKSSVAFPLIVIVEKYDINPIIAV